MSGGAVLPLPVVTWRQCEVMERWHLVQSKARNEARAAQQLDNQAFEVLLPMLQCQKLRRGRREVVSEPLFPGYLFVRFDPQFVSPSLIQSTRGVARLVRYGSVLATVNDSLIEAIRQRCEQGSSEVASDLPAAGDRVRILDGPFRDLEALFIESSGDRRAMILIELIGKTMSFEIDHGKLEVVKR